ncbi:unnamed protein product [Clavelina lepadiformis]|uniref:Uncharacterized protein n=1 Tax=Clavelina lepadiformis TaxID=159417 RepID=A0ABP0GZG0_CLALP
MVFVNVVKEVKCPAHKANFASAATMFIMLSFQCMGKWNHILFLFFDSVYQVCNMQK